MAEITEMAQIVDMLHWEILINWLIGDIAEWLKWLSYLSNG